MIFFQHCGSLLISLYFSQECWKKKQCMTILDFECQHFIVLELIWERELLARGPSCLHSRISQEAQHTWKKWQTHQLQPKPVDFYIIPPKKLCWIARFHRVLDSVGCQIYFITKFPKLLDFLDDQISQIERPISNISQFPGFLRLLCRLLKFQDCWIDFLLL